MDYLVNKLLKSTQLVYTANTSCFRGGIFFYTQFIISIFTQLHDISLKLLLKN